MHTFCLRHFEALGLRRVLLPLLCAACCWTATNQTALIAQCISSTPQDDIGCDTGPVTLHASLPSYMSGLNSTGIYIDEYFAGLFFHQLSRFFYAQPSELFGVGFGGFGSCFLAAASHSQGNTKASGDSGEDRTDRHWCIGCC